MSLIKKLYKNAFDENGKFKSFKQQYHDFKNNKTYKSEKLLVLPNNEGLEYAKIRNRPLEITEHALNNHGVPQEIIENLPYELKNSVLALDSISRPELNARVIILNRYDINGNPYVATIHQTDKKVDVEVNKLSSIYEKNNIQNFINEKNSKKGKFIQIKILMNG